MIMVAGIGLVVVLAVMIICSMKWVRKSGNFEVSRENIDLVIVFVRPTATHTHWL
jgi:hypothetical protein